MGDLNTDKHEFAEALCRFVASEIKVSGNPADYNNEAIRVADARNHLFENIGRGSTDEALDIYAIRDLCRVDEDTMEVVPDINRMLSLARNYFS